jgi:CHAT domain-containing protein
MAYDLPGTKIEVDSIEFMLKQKHVRVNTYRGRSATEESFKALSGQGKNILHLATHGFYWPEKEAQQQKFFTQNSTIESDVQQALPIDPLNRCGLLFAGANTALGGHSNRLDKGVQDGILTAKEISALDLRGADIVVLSACETGLGDVSGEGVFGLQRAFKIAGAQTMLMALWKVDDDATRMLTTAFYRYYSQGMSKRQAFRMAQQEVRSYTAEGTVSENNGRSVLHEKYKNKGKMTGQVPQPTKGGGSVTGDGLRVTEEAPQTTKGGTGSSEVSKEGGEVSHPYASPYYWAGFILLD